MSRYGAARYGNPTPYGDDYAAAAVATVTGGSYKPSRTFKVRAHTNTLLRWGRWLALALMFGQGVQPPAVWLIRSTERDGRNGEPVESV